MMKIVVCGGMLNILGMGFVLGMGCFGVLLKCGKKGKFFGCLCFGNLVKCVVENVGIVVFIMLMGFGFGFGGGVV